MENNGTAGSPAKMPAQANAEQGVVLVDAPGAVMALTPDAAERTAERLSHAAATARDQSRNQ